MVLVHCGFSPLIFSVYYWKFSSTCRSRMVVRKQVRPDAWILLVGSTPGPLMCCQTKEPWKFEAVHQVVVKQRCHISFRGSS